MRFMTDLQLFGVELLQPCTQAPPLQKMEREPGRTDHMPVTYYVWFWVVLIAGEQPLQICHTLGLLTGTNQAVLHVLASAGMYDMKLRSKNAQAITCKLDTLGMLQEQSLCPKFFFSRCTSLHCCKENNRNNFFHSFVTLIKPDI